MKLSGIKFLIFAGALLLTQAGIGQVQQSQDAVSGKDSTVLKFIENPVKDLQEVALSGGTDSLNSTLKDHPEAARFDSLWLQELRMASQSFTEMSSEIQEVAADSLNVKTDSIATELLKERLRLLDEKTPFNISYNPSLERVINHFLTHRRDLMQRMLSESTYYFPLFEETLDKYNLPLELKYLSIVESALNPTAKSRVGATGLWQFMYSTGRIYGLDVSSYVDELSDPVMATDAASRYLSKLHDIFDDWDLALAAYNS
ncbi:lytic transglycosylase domain-containing protein, partial [Robiginitalea sp.]|uniref:lytic transglycosylase domain-containing protein n=1 Tax=Robiginitalea sp. TaxID=1902411 RepID=UPI003C735D10